MLADLVDQTSILLRVYGAELPDAAKRRDPREPGRRRKHELEDMLTIALARFWRGQRKRIRERLEARYPGRKQDFLHPGTDFGDSFWDEETQTLVVELTRVLTRAAVGGVSVFADGSTIGIDYGLPNARAAEWAQTYSFELVRGVTDTTRDALRQAISRFVELPGFTIGDVIDALPLDEDRAARIATTEITRAFAEGNQLAGEQLAKEFPGVRVVKTWFTNNDDRVCPICGPLEGAEAEIGEAFIGGDGAPYDKPPAHVNCRCWDEVSTEIV